MLLADVGQQAPWPRRWPWTLGGALESATVRRWHGGCAVEFAAMHVAQHAAERRSALRHPQYPAPGKVLSASSG